MNIIDIERTKYAEIWSDVPAYRDYSPGMENVSRFMDVIRPAPGQTLIDIGCGTGEAGMEFERLGMVVRWVDITEAGLHRDISRWKFVCAALWENWNTSWKYGYDYGFCCDVMEHIPTEYTMLVIDRVLSACRTSWFQIALVPDQFGAEIGQSLHLTVRPFAWWRDRLASIGTVVDARDLCGTAMFVVRKNEQI